MVVTLRAATQPAEQYSLCSVLPRPPSTPTYLALRASAFLRCSLQVTVTATGTATKLSGVAIRGRWTPVLTIAGTAFPYSVTGNTGTSGTSLGVYTTPKSKTFPRTPRGQGCVFTVLSVTKPGYALNPSTTTSNQRTW